MINQLNTPDGSNIIQLAKNALTADSAVKTYPYSHFMNAKDFLVDLGAATDYGYYTVTVKGFNYADSPLLSLVSFYNSRYDLKPTICKYTNIIGAIINVSIFYADNRFYIRFSCEKNTPLTISVQCVFAKGDVQSPSFIKPTHQQWGTIDAAHIPASATDKLDAIEVPLGSGEAGQGLEEVIHDSTLTGKGTAVEPLGVTAGMYEKDLGFITSNNGLNLKLGPKTLNASYIICFEGYNFKTDNPATSSYVVATFNNSAQTLSNGGLTETNVTCTDPYAYFSNNFVYFKSTIKGNTTTTLHVRVYIKDLDNVGVDVMPAVLSDPVVEDAGSLLVLNKATVMTNRNLAGGAKIDVLTSDIYRVSHATTTRADAEGAALNPAFGSSFNIVTSAESDSFGHLTSVETTSVTLPTETPCPDYTLGITGHIVSLNKDGVSHSDVTIPIPTKTDELTNNSGFITAEALPTNTSDLNNDSGFITLADIPTIPTKTSELTNNSGFITSADLPEPYVWPGFAVNTSNGIKTLTIGAGMSATITGSVATLTATGTTVVLPEYSLDIADHTLSLLKDDVSIDTVTIPDNNTTYTGTSPINLNGTVFSHATTLTAETAVGPTSNKTMTAADRTFVVPYVKFNTYGHLIEAASRTMTLPSFDYIESSKLKTTITSPGNNTDVPSTGAVVVYAAEKVHQHVVADITNFPTIPTKTSELTNNSGFITVNEVPKDLSTYDNSTSKFITSADLPEPYVWPGFTADGETGVTAISAGSNVSIEVLNGVATINSTASGGGTVDWDGISMVDPINYRTPLTGKAKKLVAGTGLKFTQNGPDSTVFTISANIPDWAGLPVKQTTQAGPVSGNMTSLQIGNNLSLTKVGDAGTFGLAAVIPDWAGIPAASSEPPMTVTNAKRLQAGAGIKFAFVKSPDDPPTQSSTTLDIAVNMTDEVSNEATTLDIAVNMTDEVSNEAAKPPSSAAVKSALETITWHELTINQASSRPIVYSDGMYQLITFDGSVTEFSLKLNMPPDPPNPPNPNLPKPPAKMLFLMFSNNTLNNTIKFKINTGQYIDLTKNTDLLVSLYWYANKLRMAGDPIKFTTL